ncbi:MAG: TetR/AcrR family transcriptional regulator [Clostridia bacterium]
MKKEERKKQIILSALNVFKNNGYSASTTASIAKEADISEVTLFRYFSSKQQIFIKSVRHVFDKIVNKDIKIDPNLTKKEKFEFVLLRKINTITNNKDLVTLLLNESSLISEFQDKSFLEIVIDNFESMFNMFSFNEKEQKLIIRIIMGSILSFLYLPETDYIKQQEYVKTISNMIFNSINLGEI